MPKCEFPKCECQMPKCNMPKCDLPACKCQLPKCDCNYECGKCATPQCQCKNPLADTQCCSTSKEINEFYNYQTDADFDLNKNSVDINFTSTDYRHERIDLDDFYTTGPAIRLAQERISVWRKENQEVNSFSKEPWANLPNKKCEICRNEYSKVSQMLDTQNALAYSYWKGLDVKNIGAEVSVLKYKRMENDERVICVGCFGRSRDLKVLAKIMD